MKCLYEPCNNEAKGSSAYCSNSCRAKQSKRNHAGATGQAQPTTSKAQPKAQPQQAQPYEVVGDGRCYGRQEVKCLEFKTRPEPLNYSDQPIPLNRGRYKRIDGTIYQFDAIGHAFECTDGNVYQTMAEVKQAAAERISA